MHCDQHTYQETADLEPNLLYMTAQQTNPWRAGTPGRAPRNWRAVVYDRRPLRLFIYLALAACLSAGASPASAQVAFPAKPSVQIRLGGFLATPLVKDDVSSRAVDDSIPGLRSNRITIKQQPGPIGTIALRVPLRVRTQLEISGSVAHSTVRGDDGRQAWDVMPVTVANIVMGFGYNWRDFVALRLGVGLTRLFAEERGLFSRGNSVKPLLEGGLSTAFAAGGRPIDIDVRLQTHTFGTATLRDNGGADGNVTRAIVQIGTTLWKAGE